MGSLSLPSPPADDHHHHHKPSLRKISPHSKSSKSSSSSSSSSRSAKRSTASHSTTHGHGAHHDVSSQDSRHKRVWKACERCRMKKTKCDGEFPCKRCKDDGLVCTAGVRKKTEYKQLPRGYAEVLESTQITLVATIHKLYAMVRNEQPWSMGEPELNDRGLPVVHNIASLLGCIRPNSDLDLPVPVFPEDEAGMAELAHQLEANQNEQDHEHEHEHELEHADEMEPSPHFAHTDRASSSDSDFEADGYPYPHHHHHPGGGAASSFASSTAATASPQSMVGPAPSSSSSYVGGDYDLSPSAAGFDASTTAAMFPPNPALAQGYGGAAASWKQTMDMAQYLQQAGALGAGNNLLSQGLLESNFGRIKPHVMSCPNPEVMMGIGDPMIYSGYDDEPMRL